MTEFQISGTRRDVGRRGINDHSKNMPLRFPPGLREEFERVLKAGENKTGVIQRLIAEEILRRGGTLPDGLAVESELRRREGGTEG